MARRAAILAVSAALVALAPVGAQAATIGGTLGTAGAQALGCPVTVSGACALIQTQAAGQSVVVPFNGTIRSFAVSVVPSALPPVGGISLDAWVPVPFGYDSAGSTGPVAVPLTAGVHRFATNLPVRKGMQVGVSLAGGACCIGALPDSSARVQQWWAGAIGALPADGVAHRRLLFTADVVPAPPNTAITSSTIGKLTGKATFAFKATGQASGFRCALVRASLPAVYTSCASPKAYSGLVPGGYSFRVRAVGPGGSDPTPAVKSFTIGL